MLNNINKRSGIIELIIILLHETLGILQFEVLTITNGALLSQNKLYYDKSKSSAQPYTENRVENKGKTTHATPEAIR